MIRKIKVLLIQRMPIQKALKQEEKADLAKILTEDQRDLLRKNVVGEGPKKKDEKKK